MCSKGSLFAMRKGSVAMPTIFWMGAWMVLLCIVSHEAAFSLPNPQHYTGGIKIATKQCFINPASIRVKSVHDASAISFRLFNQLSNAGDDDNIKTDVSDDEDDGWGSSSSKTTYRSAASFIEEEEEARKKLQSSSSVQTPTTRESRPSTNTPTEPERDLFIPIFALVSLAGLFGAYGYEMVRLYMRGELYLPF